VPESFPQLTSEDGMAKKRITKPKLAAKQPTPEREAVTPDRCLRLCRLIQLLAAGPKKRETLAKRLRLDVRGFYRDLDLLRKSGVTIELAGGSYHLVQSSNEATDLLPFHDPLLTIGEVRQLGKGRTAAHRKLKQKLEHILKP
jgi:predicted DNA-binding transcriptional regulator YafY